MALNSIRKSANRAITVACFVSLLACSKNDQVYRAAKEEAYNLAYWKAHREAYDKAFPPAFAASSGEAYRERRKELVEQGVFTYKSWWLTTILLVCGVLGFALQHRVSAHARSRGVLRGDIDQLLLGEPTEVGPCEQFDTARTADSTYITNGGHQQLRSGKEQAL